MKSTLPLPSARPFDVVKSSLNQVIKSTNGSFNIYLTLAFAVGAVFGIEEATILAVLPAIGVVREIIEGIRKPRWTGNILVYVAAIISAYVPWLSGLWDSLTPIIDLIIAKEWNLVIGAILPVINIIWNLLRNKPWETDDEGEKAPAGA